MWVRYCAMISVKLGIDTTRRSREGVSLVIVQWCFRSHRSNMGLSLCDEFQALSQTLNWEPDPGVLPKRSIFRSPFRSMGIGWAITDGEPDVGCSAVVREVNR